MKNTLFQLVFVISLVVISLSSAYSQTSDLEGEWLFKKAEFAIYKYGESTLLETIVVDNVDGSNSQSFPFDKVFKTLDVSGGVIKCTLIGNFSYGDISYIVNGETLNPIISNTLEQQEISAIDIPEHTYEIAGNELKINMKYSFGNTKYAYPLEGKLLITMIKK